ncbi:MAG: hypothetical protein QXU65_01220 [Sulfolobales archaeon]
MRFVVARELEFARKALTLNPTRSLDERSLLSFIVREWMDFVVYVSVSLDEVLQVSDTIAVINNGRITGVYDRRTVEREVLEKILIESPADRPSDVLLNHLSFRRFRLAQLLRYVLSDT